MTNIIINFIVPFIGFLIGLYYGYSVNKKPKTCRHNWSLDPYTQKYVCLKCLETKKPYTKTEN